MGLLGSMVAGAVSGGAQARNEQLKAEIEEMRRLSFAKIMQEYSQENAALANDMAVARDETNYGREVGLLDKKHGWDVEGTASDRAFQLSQQEAQNKWSVSNRQPSEGDKLISRADAALKAGEIDRDTYNKITLGLTKSGGELTEADETKLWNKSAELAIKEVTSDMAAMSLPPEKRQKLIDDRTQQLYTASRNRGQGGSDVPSIAGTIQKQGGKLYQISEDGKTATLIGGEDKPKPKSKPKTQEPEKTNIDRKVEYQITLGDNRPPAEIRAEIERSDADVGKRNSALETAKLSSRKSALEKLSELPPKTRMAIEKQAQQIFDTEGGKRTKENIVKAILQARAEG